MTKEEMFHRQLVNSYVQSVAKTEFEAFMVRSELIRRTREFVGNMGPDGPQFARASTAIFFNRDAKAYGDNLAGASDDPEQLYDLVTLPLGNTTITAISL